MVASFRCSLLLVFRVKFWEKIKLTEKNLSHKDAIKKTTLHCHFQGAKFKTSLGNNKKIVSKWVMIKRFFGGAGMKNENEIKDENEASYFYVQGVQ